MARRLRIEYDGALYRVTSRGNERKAIFKHDGDRKLFLDTLAQVNKRFQWICHAYCLMDNPYHLVMKRRMETCPKEQQAPRQVGHRDDSKQQIREIPKGQRFARRPTLEQLFGRKTSDKTTRDQLIDKAVSEFGYSQMELARFLNLHYSTISRILATARTQRKNNDLRQSFIR
jgi:hypothetical protein